MKFGSFFVYSIAYSRASWRTRACSSELGGGISLATGLGADAGGAAGAGRLFEAVPSAFSASTVFGPAPMRLQVLDTSNHRASQRV